MKFCAAAVAVHKCLNPLIEKPVDQGKKWQTQAIRDRDKNNAESHNQATDELIEVFR